MYGLAVKFLRIEKFKYSPESVVAWDLIILYQAISNVFLAADINLVGNPVKGVDAIGEDNKECHQEKVGQLIGDHVRGVLVFQFLEVMDELDGGHCLIDSII